MSLSTKKKVKKHLKPMRICVFLVVLIFLCVEKSSSQKSISAQMQYSFNGTDPVRVSERDLILGELNYYQKRLNKWYASFWEEEKFQSPEDVYLRFEETNIHPMGISAIFQISDSVKAVDSELTLHLRLTPMLIDEMNKLLGDISEKVFWVVIVNIGYEHNETIATDFFKGTYQYIYPSNIRELRKNKRNWGEMPEVKEWQAREIALKYVLPAQKDLNHVYNDFLNIEGLTTFDNSHIALTLNDRNTNVISIVYHIDEATAEKDPEFLAHRSMGKKFISFLERKSEPLNARWLKFDCFADTNGTLVPLIRS